jgi:modification target Cys-rich repeat protein
MHKLTLDLDSLVVQSFHTTAPEAGRGTVHGQAAAQTPGCSFDTQCVPSEHYTCAATCPESCAQTCDTCNSCIGSCPTCCQVSCYDTCKDTCGHTCPWCVAPTTDPVHD